MATQVSGSISLDLHKVVRDTTRSVLDELTRTQPTESERDHGVPLPLDTLADRVTAQVISEIGPAIAEINTKLEALTVMTTAEFQRRDRLQVRPDLATSEFKTIRDQERSQDAGYYLTPPADPADWMELEEGKR